MKKLKSKTTEIRAGRLRIDSRVQREITPSRVTHLMKNFDLDAVGVLTVSDRGRGQYVILDGQHRWRALMDLELGDWPVTCHVYSRLSIADEARLFRELNDTKRRSAFDDFTKGVVAGDPECVAVNAVVERVGLRVHNQHQDGTVRAVAALLRVYRSANGRGDALLEEALTVARSAWGDEPDAFDGHIIEGLGRLLAEYGDQVDKAVLAKKLSKSGRPAEIVGRARSRREYEGGSVAANLATAVTALYNRGRRSGQLA